MQDGQNAATQIDPLTILEAVGHRDRVHQVGLRHDVVAFYQSSGFSITHHSSSPYGLDAWLELKL